MKMIDMFLGFYLGSGVLAVILSIVVIMVTWGKSRGLSFKEVFTRTRAHTDPMTAKDWVFLAGWITLWPFVEAIICYGICTNLNEILESIDRAMEII